MEVTAASIDGSNNAATSSLNGAVLDGCGLEKDEIILPRQFQLTTPDAHGHVLVEWRSERHELKLLVIPEEPLCCLVKALRDMIQGVC